jgi:leader peptidase (prepilin peptidase)/N-methyltransferase
VREVSSLGATGFAQVALWALIFMIGAAVGSFLNVVIFRLPRRESLVTPRSRCLSCGVDLGVIDLIPVFSYIILRGRCRHCGRPYSPRYMIVELISGLAAVGAWNLFGPGLHALVVFTAVACLIVAFFVDLDHYIIPDETVAIIAAAGVLLDLMMLMQRGRAAAVVFNERLSYGLAYDIFLPMSLVGMAMGAGSFVALAFVAERIFKRPALGWGDVKLAAAMGALLGPGFQFVTFFLIAVVVGAIVGIICMLGGWCGRKDYIPFGPMLAASGIAMMYFGDILTPVVMSRFLVA